MSDDDAAERLRRAAERTRHADPGPQPKCRYSGVAMQYEGGCMCERRKWELARARERAADAAVAPALAAAVLALLDGHGENCDTTAPWGDMSWCEMLMGGPDHECPLVVAADLLPDDAGAGE